MQDHYFLSSRDPPASVFFFFFNPSTQIVLLVLRYLRDMNGNRNIAEMCNLQIDTNKNSLENRSFEQTVSVYLQV